MRKFLFALLSCTIALLPRAVSAAADNLVSVEWLQQRLQDESLLVIDASSSRAYAAKHIPGAVSVDLYTYGALQATPA
jgi:3-mercaptopyruvate sulfurtransferase SseA